MVAVTALRTALVASLIATAAASSVASARSAPAFPSFINDISSSASEEDGAGSLFGLQREALIAALKQDAHPYNAEGADKAEQSRQIADSQWLERSGYNFADSALKQRGIDVLEAFSALPKDVMDANMQRTVAINRGAHEGAQQRAVVEAFDLPYLHYAAEGLGPRLGKVFLEAYQRGELSKAAALIKATELSTSSAKKHFDYPRPFKVQDSKVALVPDRWVFQKGHPYTASEGSFPSGHTNGGQTDALLLAAMVPERFDALVAHGDGYGFSRIVLGVHYPLDVIGGRMHAEMVVADRLNDPQYRKLFDEARQQLRTALEKGCGEALAQCARGQSAKTDPWASDKAKEFHRYTLTYQLPRSGDKQAEVEVPKGAEVLLESALPDVSAKQRRELLARTAQPAGYPLDKQGGSWQRLDLIAAHDAGQQQ